MQSPVELPRIQFACCGFGSSPICLGTCVCYPVTRPLRRHCRAVQPFSWHQAGLERLPGREGTVRAGAGSGARPMLNYGRAHQDNITWGSFSMKTKRRKNSRIRALYVRYLRPYIRQDIDRQRIKLPYFVLGYWPLILLKNLSPLDKLRLFWRFLVIDWFIVHAHRPSEISVVCRALSERRAQAGEALLEAGCFNGGSSAKFSVLCSMLGYRLSIYDSFEGVEELPPEEKSESYDFSGEYAASEELVRENIMRYGEISVCSFHKGWFADTLARTRVPYPVRVAYIDCDVAKGTREALHGIVPALVHDGWIFSQDFHITPVVNLLLDEGTWMPLGKGMPIISKLGEQIAGIRFGGPLIAEEAA